MRQAQPYPEFTCGTHRVAHFQSEHVRAPSARSSALWSLTAVVFAFVSGFAFGHVVARFVA